MKETSKIECFLSITQIVMFSKALRLSSL
jgi:hypothetical protein